MAKRRIKFKLGEIRISGLEFEIEDDRELATNAFAALQNQIAGVVQPLVSKALISSGTTIDAAPVNAEAESGKPAARKRRRQVTGTEKPNGAAEQVLFVHDPAKFGNPLQSWTTANKAIWLLWAVEQSGAQKELTAPAIAETFNQHFRQFGTIHHANVHRDLGKQRTKAPPLVGVDTNRAPQVWFLYEAGKFFAERLAKGWDGKGS